MIGISFAILTVAVVIGSGLALQFMRGPAVRRPHWTVAAVHGLVGIAGIVPLVIALREGSPPNGMGTQGFTTDSAVLLGLALLLGLVVAIVAWRRRPPGWVVGAHASLAIAGYVLLLALVTA